MFDYSQVSLINYSKLFALNFGAPTSSGNHESHITVINVVN